MHPALVAPLLPDFAQAWCQALYEIRDNEEKDSAFRGLCTLVQTNPAGIAKVSGCNPYRALGRALTGAAAELVVVLQRHCPVESAVAGTEQYVPATA